ncbi:hypothetical protein B0H11DRAFT_1257251 [Mycena galericulata]|nr:hypothetical protein B0H11DRAFT_1257251 [Mycena galericulata]
MHFGESAFKMLNSTHFRLDKRRRTVVGLTVLLASTCYAAAYWEVFTSQLLPFPAPAFTLAPVPLAAPPPSSRLLDVLFTSHGSGSTAEASAHPWQHATRHALHDLLQCLVLDSCAPNQDKVILVESMYFRMSMLGGVGGEEIWAGSTIKAMRNLGYTVLHAETLAEAVHLYRIVPDLVKIAIVDDWNSFKCYNDTEHCVQSERNPTGIPIYKILSFYFWPFPRHPLGQRWVLAPEPFALQPDPYLASNNTYLGYSIEDDCALTPFVPPADRPDDAWVLAKLLRYLHPAGGAAWTKADFDAATNATGVRFALGASLASGDVDATRSKEDVLAELERHLPAKRVNYERMPKAEFMSKVAQTKILVGVGNPSISPTPYNALCLGVPFINPLDMWDEANVDDSTKYHGQHAMMAFMKPPYVYNVRHGDREGFVNAIAAALENPIPSYIPDRMRMSEVEKRLADIVDNDWEAEEKRQAE